MLEKLGLDPVAQQIYLALVSDPDADLATVRQLAGLSEEEVRSGLDRLSELALVQWSEGGLSARPVDPSVGLVALLSRQRAEVAEQQNRIEQCQLAVEQWLLSHKDNLKTASAPQVERLDGVGAVRAKLEELASGCRDEVWSFNPGGPQSAANLARSRPLNQETLSRGVQVKAVYLDSVRNDVASVEHARWLTALGGDVRTVPLLPMRMLVVDREAALVPIDDRDSSLGALLVSGSGLVTGLVALFTSTWRVARPLGTRPAREPSMPSVQEREALALWAQGNTDEAVARRLGVSQRTVRRISESICERAGAHSRFELGARAMELGWLTADDLRPRG